VVVATAAVAMVAATAAINNRFLPRFFVLTRVWGFVCPS